tara:strand:+ start:566 stop:1003 length:438 start_codon:yes stop_codon:yes gene_type:complete
MAVDTDIFFGKDDVNKNLYRKKTYYTLVIEQEVIANNKDEADKKFSDCGINHSQINHEITETKNGVETYMVDANYTDSDNTSYMGRIVYDTDTYDQSLDDAKENGDVTIDTYEPEKEVMTPKEEDANADVLRDKDGNVMSEATSV